MLRQNEYRVIGPPGTGKTTFLARQVEKALNAGRSILMTSLTKAAASELRGKVELPPDSIGTLHAHCFRYKAATSGEKLISKKEHVADWNETVSATAPQWRLSLGVFTDSRGGDDEGSQGAPGDRLLLEMQKLRAKRVPRENWPIHLQGFGNLLSGWKASNGLCDFTDLIEHALERSECAPGMPDVIFVDEAQDHDRLELALLRKWSERAQQIVIVGDPDQNLYEFRGSEPKAFYDGEIPPENVRVLGQSYRVPRQAWNAAQKIVKRCRDRQAWDWNPREDDGELRRAWFKVQEPFDVVKQVERCLEEFPPDPENSRDGRVMILASCEYMLYGIQSQLRHAGIPFWNPYAPHRGNLNPLSFKRGTTSMARLRSLLSIQDASKPFWTWRQLWQWLEPIDPGKMLKHGAKKAIADMSKSIEGDKVIEPEQLDYYLGPLGWKMLEELERNPLQWFRERLNASSAKSFAYPMAILERFGERMADEEPRVIVGTVHSVKGGQADCVIVFPDLSPNAVDEMNRGSDSIWRMFYVAMTRARHCLILADSKSWAKVDWT